MNKLEKSIKQKPKSLSYCKECNERCGYKTRVRNINTKAKKTTWTDSRRQNPLNQSMNLDMSQNPERKSPKHEPTRKIIKRKEKGQKIY